MNLRLDVRASLATLVLVTTGAAAQPVPTASSATPESTTVAMGTLAAPDSAPNPTLPGEMAKPSEAALPAVNDVMLTPPERPARIIGTWSEALRLLRESATPLKTAQAQVQGARARKQIALGAALPQLGSRAMITDHLIRGQGWALGIPHPVGVPYPPVQAWATATLNVPLFAPRAWYDVATASAVIDSAELSARDVERQQVALLATALITVVTNERLAEVSRVGLATELSNLDLTRRRLALGAASTVDVLRIEQDVSDSRALVVAADETLWRARESLGNTIGSPEPWGVSSQLRLDALADDAAISCSREVGIELRPDVRAAYADVSIAERAAISADFAFVPTMEGISSITRYSDIHISPNLRHYAWVVGAVLSWTIYDGGVRYGVKAARKSDVSIAKQKLADVRRRASIEVNQSLRGIRVAVANLDISRKGEATAREQSRLIRTAYINGTGTSFDLVDSARRLRQAQLDLAISEFQLVHAKIAALLALATCRT